ncbi:WecB/TagA/CpsF family glycosyltransferase [Saxibacter everestensis]|uniref:WecB/TagA/CpsF family glycosyltransferase n=1 Tax=Saxibacter everestensis TaxID=2909229 RepID=A0ABY8QUY7_9MICO|nr:WecB/TagA/CpsF family glycosyltransferase [Brevibacteriaceae bacterium ZFBP1038]
MATTRGRFLGLPLDRLTMTESIRACEEAIARRGEVHSDLNAANVLLALDDADMRTAIETSEIVNADGQSVLWATRFLGVPVPERVSGIDLMLQLVEKASEKNYTVYLLGASPKVNAKVREIFQVRGVHVVGARDGYWSTAEEAAVVSDIADSTPDLLFLAMPSPKKEAFVLAHRAQLNTGLAFGVGGSFDVVAGLTKRAPRILQKLGLEWFFRMVQEPRRLLKRYLVGNVRFTWIVVKSRFSRRAARSS